MRASLADQAGAAGEAPHASLAIALGANLPSPAGPPLATLLAVRPLLEQLVERQLLEPGAEVRTAVRWSPLFRTAPVGGPPGQPDYHKAVVLVSEARRATPGAAL
ncbi:2-amino-4-hydroxy-6-hydroxymethyldihydropteridine diphosphokinase, partial [Cyanobium sp. CH-040]|nr:2-amino-4-hydroxy-6-hydroxymethyldihydropteridine diphosphokinase [Cyanobium sp. CH-040]